MNIAVIGITPIGCSIAGLLHEAGEDVTLIGPREKVDRLPGSGITVRLVWDGSLVVAPVKAAVLLDHTPELIVFATRTQDTHHAALDAAPYVGDATIATIQYGTKIEQIISRTLPRDNIVTCVLTIGANCHTPGDVTLNLKGHMVIGKAYDASGERVEQVYSVMSKIFNAHKGEKIAHYNCTRLLLNLPYCIPAIIGEKMQSAFSDIDIAKVAVLLLKEGVKVIEEAEVHIEPLPDFNEKSLKDLLAVPLDEAAVRFGMMVMGMSRTPCEGPVLGSIEHGEASEIDYLNGELVKIADVLGYATPLNSLMVRLVHEVEQTGKFLSRTEFLEQVNQERR
jgi:2-dehydropantoate 2-reductase